MTKATLAREWLWFVGSVLAAIAYFGVAAARDTSEYGGNYGEATMLGVLAGFGVYVLSGFVRLTWWAVRTTTKSN